MIKRGRCWSDENEVWSDILKRPLFNRELLYFTSILQLLQPFKVANIEDNRVWNLDNWGFSIASFFGYLTSKSGTTNERLANCIWKSGCPKKINFFIWTLNCGGLNTADVIQRSNPKICLSPNICCPCNQSYEIQNHLFVNCKFTMFLWENLLQSFNIDRCFTICSKRNIMSLRTGHPLKDKGKWIWETAVKSILWEVWLERNNSLQQQK